MRIGKSTNLIIPNIKIIPKFDIDSDYYVIKLGKKVIGNTSFRINGISEANTEFQRTCFPQSWYKRTRILSIKPHLNINSIEILQEKGKGFGRKIMQYFYDLSCQKGCEGRIVLDSTCAASGFYSHLGFDTPISDTKKYKRIFNICAEYARNTKISQQIFNDLLKNCGCPTMTNGKFNAPGIRFFDPIKENIEKLFKH